MVLKAHNDRANNRTITVDLMSQLTRQLDHLNEGSKWKKWDGWTKPENFRVYTPHYTVVELENRLKKIK